jgi:Legionella pneumophila major outer membrane protein precursor
MHGTLRLTLLAGVSALALAAAAQNVRAADLTPRMATKAPAAIVKESWTWWVEGGAFQTGGKAVNDFGDTIFGVFPGYNPDWGAEGAVGFDWSPQAYSPWHVSAQFRYGAARKSRSLDYVYTYTPGPSPVLVTSTGNEDLHESHWLVDFAVGREFGLGSSNAQWKIGVRVADLRAKVGIAETLTTATPAPSPFEFSYEQKSRFFGVGPRIGVEGETPLGGAWSLDWLGGVAVLFGERKFDTNNIETVGGSSISFAEDHSDHAAILNLDAQLGLSYWFNPNVKLTASYRFDGYFNAIRIYDTSGNLINVDRFYYGPMLRLTSKF